MVGFNFFMEKEEEQKANKDLKIVRDHLKKVHVNLTVDQIPFQYVRKRKGL